MDRNELKKKAIESMSACGALMHEENYVEAKKLAEEAWNAYFQLQKTRTDDEDFTDLIYWARGYYYDCENNIRLQEQQRKEALEREIAEKEQRKIDEIRDMATATLIWHNL